jgi:hypothetical protein
MPFNFQEFFKLSPSPKIELFSFKNPNHIRKSSLFFKINGINPYSVLFCKIRKLLFLTSDALLLKQMQKKQHLFVLLINQNKLDLFFLIEN